MLPNRRFCNFPATGLCYPLHHEFLTTAHDFVIRHTLYRGIVGASATGSATLSRVDSPCAERRNGQLQRLAGCSGIYPTLRTARSRTA